MFNADDTLHYTQDADGNRVTAAYVSGHLTSLTATDGDTFTFTYNAAGLCSEMTDPVGRVTTYTYDPTNQVLVSMTNAEGTTSFTYYSGDDLADQYAITSVSYPDGTHTYYTYDDQGRLTSQSRDGSTK